LLEIWYEVNNACIQLSYASSPSLLFKSDNLHFIGLIFLFLWIIFIEKMISLKLRLILNHYYYKFIRKDNRYLWRARKAVNVDTPFPMKWSASPRMYISTTSTTTTTTTAVAATTTTTTIKLYKIGKIHFTSFFMLLMIISSLRF